MQQLCAVESFNLINKCKAEPFKQEFSLLASAYIEDGFCKYSFSPMLIPYLANPPMYAKVNLLIQQQFTSKYSLVIYELCLDYAGIERTPNFTLEEFKRYLGIAEHEYKEFKHFNYKIIKKVILEVNKKSDLLIAVKFDAKHEKVVVWFTINEKPRTAIDVKKLIAKARGQSKHQEIAACPFQQLKNYGVSHQKVIEISDIFKPIEIQLIINEMKRDIKKICDPAAWLTAMFNKKKPQSPSLKINCAVKCKMIEDQDLKREHIEFVKDRVKDEWEKLPEDRKNTLSVTFEQWMAKQY